MEKSKPAVGWAETISKGSDNHRLRANKATSAQACFASSLCMTKSLPLFSTHHHHHNYHCISVVSLGIYSFPSFPVSLIIAELPKACFMASPLPSICHHAHIYSWINTEGGKEGKRGQESYSIKSEGLIQLYLFHPWTCCFLRSLFVRQMYFQRKATLNTGWGRSSFAVVSI